MSNRWYPLGLDAIGAGAVNLIGGNVKCTALVAGYVYSSAHQFYSSVAAPQRAFTFTLASPTLASGVFDAADHVEASVAGGLTIVALVIWLSTGVDATSRLLLYDDIGGDTGAISVPTFGGPVTITWSNGPSKIAVL